MRGRRNQTSTHIRLHLVRVPHAAHRNPVARNLGRPGRRLSDAMERHLVLGRAVAEVRSGIGDEEVAHIASLAVFFFPILYRADIYTVELVIIRVAQETQMTWLEDSVYCIIACEKGYSMDSSGFILEVIAPHLGVAPVVVRDRSIAATKSTVLAVAGKELGSPSVSRHVSGLYSRQPCNHQKLHGQRCRECSE